MIQFNKPYFTGKETEYIRYAVDSGKISGNGIFTHKCHDFFEKRYGFKKTLLTTSCTDALEMCALLINVKPGDEIIMPSYTFVSTANAFVLCGAKIVFADSCDNSPNIDADKIESLITERTKAIVPVHYAGMACDMDKINALADKYSLFVIEDSAQAIESFYRGKPLGTLGNLAAFSFHETKNIISGEGGMLTINDEQFLGRSEIIWEKGTNRAQFMRGEINKYDWVDIGSSFLPSEVTSAFLYAQLEHLEQIQEKRKYIWQKYYDSLKILEDHNLLELPSIPDYATNNGHLFYIITKRNDQRNQLLEYLNKNGIYAVFHYLSLHRSPYYESKHDGRALPNCDKYAERLLRLPLYFELKDDEIDYIINKIYQFYNV